MLQATQLPKARRHLAVKLLRTLLQKVQQLQANLVSTVQNAVLCCAVQCCAVLCCAVLHAAFSKSLHGCMLRSSCFGNIFRA